MKKDMCIACGSCSTYCEMGIDVRAYAMCAHAFPRVVLKLAIRSILRKAGQPTWVHAVDLQLQQSSPPSA